jgi:hypothetical protein
MAVDYRSLDCAMAMDSDKGGRINQSPCKPLIPQGSNIEGTNRSDPFIARGLLPMQAASDRRSGRPAASPLGPLQSRVKSVIAAPGSARLRKHVAEGIHYHGQAVHKCRVDLSPVAPSIIRRWPDHEHPIG